MKQSKCEEIDEQLETLETYVCDSLCCHRQEKLSQEAADILFLARTGVQWHICQVRQKGTKIISQI